ncbi:hypothetical protein ATCC90586_007310 [Pythium insidiosum]|nr:hypothetical protein ATCC90586_007310 [Pythium insidiosum]
MQSRCTLIDSSINLWERVLNSSRKRQRTSIKNWNLHNIAPIVLEDIDPGIVNPSSQKKSVGGSYLASPGSRRRRRVPPRDAAGVSELTTSARLGPDAQQREIVVSARIASPWLELLHVLESTALDALDAALLACLADPELDATHLLETIETSVEALDENTDGDHEYRRWGKGDSPLWGTLQLKKLRALAPTTSKPSLSSASKWLRSTVRSKETGSPTASLSSATERLLIDYGRRTDGSAIASRVVQALASHIGPDHAASGDAVAGYLLQGDSSGSSVVVSVYSSQRRKMKRGISWGVELVPDTLVEAMTNVISWFWHAVVGRRLAFQALTYPDFVYGLDTAEAEQDETHCPGCSTAGKQWSI